MDDQRVPMALLASVSRLPATLRRGIPILLWPVLLLEAAGGAAQQVEIPPELQNPQTTVSIRADSQEKDHDTYLLRGHVDVTYREMKLTADEASFNEAAGDVRAKGHVTFSDPTSRFEADEAFYNIRTQTGWFSNGRGTVHAKVTPRSRLLLTENPFYVRASRVERRSETSAGAGASLAAYTPVTRGSRSDLFIKRP